MKLFNNVLSRLVVAALCISAARPQTPLSPDLYLLLLTVTETAGTPLAGVEIRLDDVVIGATDSAGKYCLARKPLPAGSHTLQASLPGFTKVSRAVLLPAGDAPGIEIAVKLARERSPELPEVQRGTEPNYSVVPVFYVTDRQDTGSRDPLKRFANQRSSPAAISRGICEVSIPATHHAGGLESPSWLHFEFRPDPNRHVILGSVQPLEIDPFYKEMRTKLAASKSKEVVVFIHGYKVSFEFAARQAAQLTWDLGFDGAPILYSWPSKDSLVSYTEDEDTILWTAFHLRAFLEELAQRSHAARIHLVAHSMGNRALANALQIIAAKQRPGARPAFHQIVLAAPDIGAETLELFAREIRPAVRRITLYASSNDDALLLSRYIHGASRAGQKGKYLLVSPGIDTIDASAVRTDFLGHTYFSNSGTIIDDILKILTKEAPPELRNLVPALLGNLKYWIIRSPTAPAVVYR